jgi:hypothetical protein
VPCGGDALPDDGTSAMSVGKRGRLVRVGALASAAVIMMTILLFQRLRYTAVSIENATEKTLRSVILQGQGTRWEFGKVDAGNTRHLRIAPSTAMPLWLVVVLDGRSKHAFVDYVSSVNHPRAGRLELRVETDSVTVLRGSSQRNGPAVHQRRTGPFVEGAIPE